MNADLKALLKIIFDLNIIFISCFIASSISSGETIPFSKSFILFFIITSTTIIPLGAYFKIYHDISRYFNLKNVLYIFLTSLISFVLQIIFVSILEYFDFNFIFFLKFKIFITVRSKNLKLIEIKKKKK